MMITEIALSKKCLNIINELSNIYFKKKYIPNVNFKDIYSIKWHPLLLTLSPVFHYLSTYWYRIVNLCLPLLLCIPTIFPLSEQYFFP